MPFPNIPSNSMTLEDEAVKDSVKITLTDIGFRDIVGASQNWAHEAIIVPARINVS